MIYKGKVFVKSNTLVLLKSSIIFKLLMSFAEFVVRRRVTEVSKVRHLHNKHNLHNVHQIRFPILLDSWRAKMLIFYLFFQYLWTPEEWTCWFSIRFSILLDSWSAKMFIFYLFFNTFGFLKSEHADFLFVFQYFGIPERWTCCFFICFSILLDSWKWKCWFIICFWLLMYSWKINMLIYYLFLNTLGFLKCEDVYFSGIHK